MISYIKRKYWNFRSHQEQQIKDRLLSFYCEHTTRILYFLRRPKKHHPLPKDLIVSLTSYPPRFPKLHLTLKSLTNQTISADKILLWIAYSDRDQLPTNVLKMQREGDIEINFCEDLGPGKKILPTLKHHPDAFIATADDDLYYHHDWLKKLVAEWTPRSNNIFAHRIHRIKIKNDGTLLPYHEWDIDVSNTEPNDLHFATGCAGILYPPNSLHYEVTNIEKYNQLCQKQDDIWLYWMARLNGQQIQKTQYVFKLVQWNGTASQSLYSTNQKPDGNDLCIAKMINEYGLPFQTE